MEEKLTQYLDKIVEALETGVEFAGEQAPIFIQEVLSYYIYFHSVWLIVGVIFTATGIGLFLWTKKKNDESNSRLDDWGFGMGLSFIPITGGFVLFVIQLLEIIKITVAPRLYLIEKISSLF